MDFRRNSVNYIRFFGCLIVVILINVAGITLFFRLDLTQNKIYSVSRASQKAVSTLSEPLTIKVFFTRNLPAPHNNTERYLHDLLEEYAIYGNQYFNYRFYDVSPEEGEIRQEAKENQELARSYGINPIQIQLIEKDEVKFQRAYMGLVVIHGDMVERIPTITSTDGLEYRLTMAIQKLNNKISALLNLSEKIRMKLFFSSSLNIVAPFMRLDELGELPDKLEGIVDKLNDKNYGKLQFESLDPTKDKSLKPLIKKYNIMNLKWPSLSDGQIQPGEGAIGLVMEYGSRALTIPLIRVLRLPLIGTRYELVDVNKMEEIIDENIESLIDIHEGLGYLADHGALRISGRPMEEQREEVLNRFRGLVSQNYTLKEVSLKDGSILHSTNCLVIAGPTQNFTDFELFQIDQFLMRGKALAIFLDAFKEVVPGGEQPRALRRQMPPNYVPLNTGLEKLLEHYGVRVKASYVMDESCYRQQVPARFGGGERAIYFAPLIKKRFINRDLRFMKDIKGLVAMKMSPIELDEKRITENGLKAYRILASSERSWEMRERINLNPFFIRPPPSGDEKGSLPLAYLLEGEFPSYFAGKPIPEKKLENKDSEQKEGQQKESTDEKNEVDLSRIEEEGVILSKGKPGKIFLIASSEMLKDNMLDEGGRTPNSMFIMNVIDYLNNREDTAVMRSKEQRFNPLDETGAVTKTFVKSFNIAGLPILVVVFGIVIWFRRHSRKKYIKAMFHPN